MPILETSLFALLIWAILGYLFGSIPFGVLIARVMGLGNLRDIGSGNIGATNVLRTGNKKVAAGVLLADLLKGAIAALIARAMAGEDAAQVAGLMALIGHCYPIWLKFKGGKGVAVFLGILLAINFWAGLATCLTWLVTAVAVRISSASALVASLLAPVWLYLIDTKSGVLMAAMLAVLIWVKHLENIKRIIKGTEPKIGKRG